MNKKLVLIIEDSNFDYSGAKVRNDNLINELKNNYKIIRLSFNRILFYENKKIKNLNIFELIKFVLNYNFSITFMTDLFIVSLVFPLPIVFTVHDMKDWSRYKRRGKFKKFLFKLMYYKPGISWIAISDYVKYKLKKEINVNSTVIPNSIGNEWFNLNKNKNKKYKAFGKYALYVSNFAKHKGHEDLLNIIDQIQVDKIILVGTPVDFYGKLIHDKLKKNQKFLILKNVKTNDLISLVDQSYIVIYPSFYEGYGIPIGEAIARKKKVLVNKKIKKFIFRCKNINFISFNKKSFDFKNRNYKNNCECSQCAWQLRWKHRAEKLSKKIL
ncbi:glycosyltransferase [Candidatus Pelagibacter sp. HIMB1695]|uniref:glycosyltransferase n=1 Tax=Candidatus Pelagibacter sp. HIMB1695 TaxID=3413364 RepID=UPI003F8552CD